MMPVIPYQMECVFLAVVTEHKLDGTCVVHLSSCWKQTHRPEVVAYCLLPARGQNPFHGMENGVL